MKFEKGQWVVVRRATGDCTLFSDVRYRVEDTTDSLVKLEGERGWWAHDRFELSENQFGPGDMALVRFSWVDSTERGLSLVKDQMWEVSACMGDTISLVGKPANAWYRFDRFEKQGSREARSEPVLLADAVRELATALVETRKRLGESTMPAEEGWAWYDALKKHAPDMLPKPKPRCLAVLKRGSHIDEAAKGGWWIRCDKEGGHGSPRHRSAITEWGDGAIGATYLVEGTDD